MRYEPHDMPLAVGLQARETDRGMGILIAFDPEAEGYLGAGQLLDAFSVNPLARKSGQEMFALGTMQDLVAFRFPDDLTAGLVFGIHEGPTLGALLEITVAQEILCGVLSTGGQRIRSQKESQQESGRGLDVAVFRSSHSRSTGRDGRARLEASLRISGAKPRRFA